MDEKHVTVPIIFTLLTVFLLVRVFRLGRRPSGYPPGPPTLPILGNIHQMPKHDSHKQFQKWAQEYGPVYSLILGTKTLIVLSSDVAVKDLLDKRSAIYSDRPDMYIGMTLCSGGLRILMMRYGPTWRIVRKIIHELIHVHAAHTIQPYQNLESKQMLYDMLNSPNDFLGHIRRYNNSIVTSMTFGWRVPLCENEYLTRFCKGFHEFSLLNQTGTATLVDLFPILRSLPEFIIPAQRAARIHHQQEKALYLTQWLDAKQKVINNTALPCFSVSLVEKQAQHSFSDDLAAYISGTLLEAGTDTTSNALYAFVQAMVAFPGAQQKAQASLDAVIGPDRLPTLDDEPSLQCIRACVKETLRWFPPNPLGAVPHAALQDDEYMGFTIPKGAGVINNIYTINMDPIRHPDPRKFDPDRYMDDKQSTLEAAINPDPAARDHFTFGAGRRICQGLHVAERSLFLAIARLLWAFDIAPPKDEQGNPVVPDIEEITQGFVSAPLAFRAVITPRSKEREDLILREWMSAETEMLEKGSMQWKAACHKEQMDVLKEG